MRTPCAAKQMPGNLGACAIADSRRSRGHPRATALQLVAVPYPTLCSKLAGIAFVELPLRGWLSVHKRIVMKAVQVDPDRFPPNPADFSQPKLEVYVFRRPKVLPLPTGLPQASAPYREGTQVCSGFRCQELLGDLLRHRLSIP